MPFDDLGETSFASFASSWTSSGQVLAGLGRDRDERGLFEEGAFDEFADLVLHEREPVLVHHVHLGQHDQALFHMQEVADGKVLAGLGHDAFVRGDHEHHDVHAADAGKHVLDQPFMAGNVHDAEAVAAGKVEGREAEVKGDAALLLFLEAVGVRAGEGLDEGRFPVVDMSGCAEDDVFHRRSVSQESELRSQNRDEMSE